jgi:hypothetical protein
MKLRSSGVLAGTLLALLPATALAGPTVKVRVEGQSGTLLARTTVTLPDTPPPVAGGCPRYTAAAALEEGTHGNWDRQSFTQSILGESHTFTDSDYWAEWIDRGTGYRFGAGICTDVLNDGDELLMLVDRSPAPDFAPTVFPLDLDGVPSSVAAGTPFTVTVVEYRPGATGDPQAVEGATVSDGHATATTDRDGKASLRIGDTGTVTLKATKPGLAPSGGEVVNVTAAPAQSTAPASTAPDAPESGPGTPPAVAPPAVTAPTAAGAPADTRAPRLAIAGLRSRAVFTLRRAPRLLRGTVSDASALKSVELSIVRRRAGACQYWSSRRERFLAKRCNGTQPAFPVGTTARWSYQLPARLPAGRYYIRVAAVDIAGNRAATRVVIRVG